jgi:hypothetical protein
LKMPGIPQSVVSRKRKRVCSAGKLLDIRQNGIK